MKFMSYMAELGSLPWLLIIVIIIIIVVILAVCISGLSPGPKYRDQNKNEEIEAEKNLEYHQEKTKKLADHYYRAIEFRQNSNSINQDYNIVGFEAPKGKWTKMIMKQNLQYLSTLKNLMGNNFSKAGIWQLKVKAQNLISQAFHKGKGR